MASGTVKKIANLVRGLTSLLVGIPTAVAASVIVGTLFFAVELTNVLASHLTKNTIYQNVFKFSPGLEAASQFLKGSLVKIWSQWGVYPYIETAKFFTKTLDEFTNFHEEGDHERLLSSKSEEREKQQEKERIRREQLFASERAYPKLREEEVNVPDIAEISAANERKEEQIRRRIGTSFAELLKQYETDIPIDLGMTVEELIEKQKKMTPQEKEKDADNILAAAQPLIEERKKGMDESKRKLLDEVLDELRNPGVKPKDPVGKNVKKGKGLQGPPDDYGLTGR